MKSEGCFWPGLQRHLPVLGFGGWQIAGPHDVNGRPNGWGAVGEDLAIALVGAALDDGIRFFDTAQGYGNGRGEELLGRGLAAHPLGGDAVVCTKLPVPAGMEAQPADAILSWLGDAVEGSRKRLRRDVIDIVLLHNPPDDIGLDPLRAAFQILQAGGLVRTYGVSARSLAGANRFVAAEFGTCIEWNYSILERRPEAGLLQAAGERKINFIARSPLYRGLLTERFLDDAAASYGADDIRSTLDPALTGWVRQQAGRVRRESVAPSQTISAFALAYVLSNPLVSCAIPGISKPQHLQSAVAAWQAADRGPATVTGLPDGLETHYPLF